VFSFLIKGIKMQQLFVRKNKASRKRHSINIPAARQDKPSSCKQTVTITKSSMTVSYEFAPKLESSGPAIRFNVPSQDPLRHFPSKEKTTLGIATSVPLADSDEECVYVSDSEILIPPHRLPQRIDKARSEDMLDEDSEWVVIDHNVLETPHQSDLCDDV
jgi:hypothetical protein